MAGVLAGLVAALATVALLTLLATFVFFGGDFDAPPTRPYLALNLAYTAAAAVLGGWLPGRIAGRAPLSHATAVALVMALPALLGQEGPAAPGVPEWYGTSVSVLGAAGALIGGVVGSVARRTSTSAGASPR